MRLLHKLVGSVRVWDDDKELYENKGIEMTKVVHDVSVFNAIREMQPDVTIARISEHLGLPVETVSRSVKNLVASGRIEKTGVVHTGHAGRPPATYGVTDS